MNPYTKNDPGDLLILLQQHLAWYPHMQVQDIYKLIFQAAMGPEHSVATKQEFARSLEDEYRNLTPQPGRLLEPIRPDHTLYRLNLRPLRAWNKDIHRFVGLLLQTSRLFNGDKTELVQYWAGFIKLIEAGKLTAFAMSDILHFNRLIEQEDYPAVHHSEGYRRAYQPAYRLIKAQFIPEVDLYVTG